MRIPRRRAGWVAAIAALSLTLAACSGSSDSGSSSTADGSSAAAQESGTLKLWHYESANGAMGIAWDKAIEIFKTEHPGVTVDFERKAFEQIQQNAGMIISSDEGPDIMEYNKGNATAGLLASQGLLTDLTEQATARGWDTTLPPSLQTTAKYDEKGVDGLGQLVRRTELRRVRDGLLQQGRVRRERHRGPDHTGRVHRCDGHLRRRRHHPAVHGRRGVPGRSARLPAGPDQGGPLVRRRLPALQEPGRLPGRPAEVRRGHLRRSGSRRATSRRSRRR